MKRHFLMFCLCLSMNLTKGLVSQPPQLNYTSLSCNVLVECVIYRSFVLHLECERRESSHKVEVISCTFGLRVECGGEMMDECDNEHGDCIYLTFGNVFP